tara:strand:- start:1553 stop:2476 length:924 start_codon:yes stop_codon:yes gene_type:complete
MITKNYRSRNSCQNHSDCFSYEYCDSEFLCYSCFEYDSFCDTYNGLCPGHCSAYTLNEGLEDCVECWDELNECIDDSDCVPYCYNNNLNYNGQCNLNTNICSYSMFNCTDTEICFVNDYGEGFCAEASEDTGCGLCDPFDCGYDNMDLGCFCDEFCAEYGDCCPGFSYPQCCGGEIWGCTDSNACNYNPNANVEDNSCDYGIECPDGSFACTIAECPDDILMGDVNLDGQLNVLDVVQQVGYVLDPAAVEYTEQQINAMDMNQDGVINVLDVVMLVQLILGRGMITQREGQTLMKHLKNLPRINRRI